LSITGLFYLSTNKLLLSALVIWLSIACAGYALLWFLNKRKSRLNNFAKNRTGKKSDESGVYASTDEEVEELPEELTPKAHWTTHDTRVWNTCYEHIEALLNEEPMWSELPEYAVSAMYHDVQYEAEKIDKKLPYRFTLPEALLVLAVTSQRYRKLVLSHIPYSEKVSVSSLFTLYDHQSELKTGYTWMNRTRRLLRLWNPLAAVVGELREHLTDRIFRELSAGVQNRLKRLLLQEVVQVGMELYSGRLKTSDSELLEYRSSAMVADTTRQPEAVEPLRVVVVGQVSSGKSSLINAVTQSLSAEIDNLPSTQKAEVHEIELEGGLKLHLLDTEGLDGSSIVQDRIVELAKDADLILFTSKSTQPAKGPDQLFLTQLTNTFLEMPARRMPPCVLVMTHIDELAPRTEWSPPYDLNGSSQKAININLAMSACIEQIELPSDTPTIPVSLSNSYEAYNADAVVAQIFSFYDEAVLSQWNRRRLESGQRSISWSERFSQFKRLGQVLSKGKI